MCDVWRPLAARLIAALGLASIAFLTFTDVAAAQQEQRVVVSSFRGPQAGRLRGSLIQNLEGQQGVRIISAPEVDQARRELGEAGNDRARLAQKLRATAVLEGTMRRRRRGWALTVVVRNPATGEVLGSETWGGRTIADVGGVRRNGYERLAPHIRAAAAARNAAAAQAAAAAQQQSSGTQGQQGQQSQQGRTGQTTTAQTSQQQQQQQGQTASAGGEQGSEEQPSGAEEPSEEEDEGELIVQAPVENEEETEEEQGERFDALRVSFSGGVLHRSMMTNVVAFNQEVNPPDPSRTVREERNYVSGGTGHSELGLEIEVYPWSFESPQTTPWLGAVARYRRGLGVSSHGPPCEREGCPESPVIDVGTSQWELYAGARGRIRLGDTRRAPHIYIDAGYGMFVFDLATEDLQQLERKSIVAPFHYSYLQGGLGFTYGLVPTYLEIGLNAAYRFGIDIGSDAKAVWGRTTKTMSGLFGGATLRTEMPYLTQGLFLSVTGEYFRFSTEFSGQTVCIDACPPGGPWEEWPADPIGSDNLTGGIPDPVIDEYFRLSVALGYAIQ